MIRRHAIVLLLALPLSAFVCGQSYSPGLENDLGEPATIAASYANGKTVSGTFPSGARIWAPQYAERLTRLEVTSQSGVRFRLDEAELERLRGGTPSTQRILWMIRADGVHPVVMER